MSKEDLKFSNADSGICEYYSGMLLTVDGGKTWRACRLPTSESMLDAEFTTPLHGWASAYGDGLYVTSDGGESWNHYDFYVEEIYPGFEAFNGIALVEENKGWLAGYRGCVMRFHEDGISEVRENPGGDRGTDMSIHPNPAHWLVTVGIGRSIAAGSRLVILSAAGKEVYHTDAVHAPTQSMTLDVSSLPSGAYYVSVLSESGERISRPILIRAQ
jgi:hypothetical protein